MSWISVKERYPNPLKESVAYAYDGKNVREDIYYHTMDGWCIDKGMEYYGKFKGKITHWIPAIPFPKPPEDLL